MASGLRNRIATTIERGVTDPPAPRARWLRRGRVDLVFVADVLTAVICFAITASLFGNGPGHHAVDAELIVLVPFALCAPLLLRTRYPLAAWTACLFATFLASRLLAPYVIPAGSYVPAIVVYALCLYAVAVRCKPWVAVSAGAVTVLEATALERQNVITVVFITATVVFGGFIVRSQRGGRQQLAVAEQRHSGERALLQERQRIARELHDVVAHHMSVIAIQAEAAPYKTADPPPELVESFADIRASALGGLSELRRVLGVLRSEATETAPQPGLGDLAGLLESARTGGVTVTCSVTGAPRPLPEGVDLSAYRIVQEALSNAMRHAPESAVQVKLYYGEAALVIEVRNDGLPPDGQGLPEQTGVTDLRRGGGHGIIGMRERVTMLGGNLQAGPTGKGEFLVTAALPMGGVAGSEPAERGAAGSGPALGDGEPEDAS